MLRKEGVRLSWEFLYLFWHGEGVIFDYYLGAALQGGLVMVVLYEYYDSFELVVPNVKYEDVRCFCVAVSLHLVSLCIHKTNHNQISSHDNCNLCKAFDITFVCFLNFNARGPVVSSSMKDITGHSFCS